MLRTMAVAATMALLVGRDVSGQEPTKGGEPEVPGLVATRNTGRDARPGDRAEIYDQETPAATSIRSLDGLVKAKAAFDRVGIEEHTKTKAAFLLPAGTRILVIKPHLQRADMTPMSPDDYQRELSASITRSRALEAVEVRIVDGPLKDRALFVPVDSVALLKPPDPKIVKAKALEAAKAARLKADAEAKARLATPAARAASLLAIAKNLEKSGKPRPALENYRRIVAEFGDTPSAAEAAARIGALAGK